LTELVQDQVVTEEDGVIFDIHSASHAYVEAMIDSFVTLLYSVKGYMIHTHAVTCLRSIQAS
jgi:phosphoenolpyruvate synthase/pyruvate phosphate dikinase